MSAEREKLRENLPVPVRTPEIRPTVQRSLPPIIAEFQSDAIELEERVPPRIARMTLYGITALLAAAIAWASVSEIDEVVIAPGKLITTQPTIILQPLETSIIRTIEVSAGEVVRAGQTLATLDATFSQSDVDQQRAKFSALDAQVRRIEAELAGTDYTASADKTPNEVLQVQLFEQRRAFHAAQLQNFDQQVAGQVAAIASSRDEQAVLVNRRDNLASRTARSSISSTRAMRGWRSTQACRRCVAGPPRPITPSRS
jgi:HlyD family secretion protein